MANVKTKYRFAISNQMWYDIPTGDILTTNTASKMVKTKIRLADTTRKLLANNAMQFSAFEVTNLGTKGDPTLKVKIYDRWSDTTFAIQVSDALDKDIIKRLLLSNSVSNFEFEGNLIIVSREFREVVSDALKSQKHRVKYISKEVRDQGIRSENVVVAHAHSSSKKDQDRYFRLVLDQRMLVVVCDGHGRDDVINYITANKNDFLHLIGSPFPSSQSEALERTQQVFITFENKMRQKITAAGGGSTMVFAAHDLKENKVYFGYIGDSRAVYRENQNSSYIATKDHKPSDPEEHKRITSLGGFVSREKNDVPRVNRDLATSRSFGDESLKHSGEDRRLDLVSVIPDVLGPYHFGEQSVYVMASDGLFDVVNSHEAIDIASKGRDYKACSSLITMARERGSRDDIMVAIVSHKMNVTGPR